MLDPLQLARDLISIPSETGNEARVASFLDELLSREQFATQRFEVEPGRFNLLGTAGGRPRVILCSHLDTVPPFFVPRETTEHLFGRGACDAKGIIAAMVAAGAELRAGNVRDFGFLFVVGEETDSIGAKQANGQLAGHGSEYVVVGEPTESTFVRASKGALTCTIGFQGIAAHSAHPERGESAVRKLVEALRQIDTTAWGDDPDLGRGTVNIGVIRGGRKANIVPDSAEAEMIFRTVEPVRDVEARLRAILEATGGTIVRSHGNDPVRMMVPAGRQSTVVAFNTDAAHLTRLGRPVLFGPGSILDAHSAEEKIAKAEILAAVETYRDLVKSLLDNAG